MDCTLSGGSLQEALKAEELVCDLKAHEPRFGSWTLIASNGRSYIPGPSSVEVTGLKPICSPPRLALDWKEEAYLREERITSLPTEPDTASQNWSSP